MKFKSIKQRLVLMPSDSSTQKERQEFFLSNIDKHLANRTKANFCKDLLERMPSYDRSHAIDVLSAQDSMIKLINSKSHIKSPQYVFGFKDGVKKLTSLLVNRH